MTEKKMNPEVKERWLSALRSGEYKQTVSVLKDSSGGFCCLGVLCDLYAKTHSVGRDWNVKSLGWGGRDDEPSAAVAQWAGLTHQNPGMRVAGTVVPISDMNDGNKTKGVRLHSFAEIADAIEAQL